MKISDWLDTEHLFKIGDCTFEICDVNMLGNYDVDTPTDFQDELKYSFLERIEKAKAELEELVGSMTPEEAMRYFKENTEDGNIHYWGCWFAVYTKEMQPPTFTLDIRMD